MARTVPVSIYRGGTSRGVFVRLNDLPAAGEARDDACRQFIGSPDPMHLDGLGGSASSTCKVMAVARPEDFDEPGCDAPPDGVDLVSFFAQVGVADDTVDWAGNCGNLTSAVSAFGYESGLLTPSGPTARVKVWNANTGGVFELVHALDGGRLPAAGDCRISGVMEPAARVDVRYLSAGGGAAVALPDGPRSELAPGLVGTAINVASPLVILRAEDVGVDLVGTPESASTDVAALPGIDALRRAGAAAMGLDATPAVPRVALIGPGDDDADLRVRMISLGAYHHASPVTAALAVGAAGALGGTIVADVATSDVSRGLALRHPKGLLEVTADVRDGKLEALGLVRSARLVMSGQFLLR